MIKRFADVDRVDAVAVDVVGERVVERLHDEARGDAAHTFALGLVAELAHVDLLGASLLDDLLAVVELELGHQVALSGRLEAREDREHRSDLERVRRDVGAEVGVADDLLVDLHFFGEPEVVRHLDDDDAVEDRFVGVIRLELLPFGFVRVRELRDETEREGISSISTRFIMKALDNALSDNVDGNCINPINVREALIGTVKEGDLPDESRQQLPRVPPGHAAQGVPRPARERDHLSRLRLLLSGAGRGAVPEYLDHAEAYVNKTQVKDRNTKEELLPDEGFLKSIEEQIAIIGSAAEGFRQEVIAYLWVT